MINIIGGPWLSHRWFSHLCSTAALNPPETIYNLSLISPSWEFSKGIYSILVWQITKNIRYFISSLFLKRTCCPLVWTLSWVYWKLTTLEFQLPIWKSNFILDRAKTISKNLELFPFTHRIGIQNLCYSETPCTVELNHDLFRNITNQGIPSRF